MAPVGKISFTNDTETNNQPVFFSELKYISITCECMSEPITALRDLGAEVSLVKEDLIKDLDLPSLGLSLIHI